MTYFHARKKRPQILKSPYKMACTLNSIYTGTVIQLDPYPIFRK